MNTNFKPVEIEFKNLTYSIKSRKSKDQRNILSSVSGIFKAGELTAIMGSSGCGKTSLLNILTGFTRKGVTGDIIMGSTIKKNRKLCSYILQDDNLFPWFTVDETMLMAATLKISNTSMNRKEKRLLIDNILDSLRLSHTRQTKCSNLSGGQKKRLSIALELLDNPPILFLDEPTTGLDSASSSDCVNLLHQLSREGRTIVCTIHQPSASIYELCDHVYVLGKGYCLYQGSSKNTVDFLSSLGLNCPQYHNAADFLLEVVNGDYGDHTDLLKTAAQDTAKWRSLPASTQDEQVLNLSKRMCADQIKHVYPPAEWIKLWVLIGRCHVQFYRDWTVTYLKLILHIFCSILIGIIFGDSGTNATKVFSNIGLFVVGVVYLWYTTMMPGVLRFPLELPTIRKEVFNNWYKLRTYFLATLITSTPVHIIFSSCFSTIIYLMTDQPLEVKRYVKFAFTLILITMTADGFGVFLGTILSPVNGTFLGAVSACFMLIYAGFLVLYEHIPSFMRIFGYLSAHKFALEGLILSVYDDGRSDMICPDEIIYCHLKKANLIMKTFGMKSNNYELDAMFLMIQMVVYKGLSYFTLRRALRGD